MSRRELPVFLYDQFRFETGIGVGPFRSPVALGLIKGKFRDEIGRPPNQGFQRLKTLSRN